MPERVISFRRLLSRGPIVAGLVLAAASAIAQQAPRTVLPIREIVIRPLGPPRFAVTIQVNGVPIETGLDTGSVGLRILPPAARRAGVVAGAQAVTYSYGSGVQLDGHRSLVDLQLGAMRARVPVQSIERVSCRGGQSCPAANVPQASYGLMGSGQPGQGFQAIMGTRLNGGDVPNPLTAAGVRRWIVHLPQRGGQDGALILNPDARDLAGFTALRAGTGMPGSVAGCLMVARPDARRICGPTLLDTGAPGLHARGADRPPAWQRGVEARLALVNAGGGGSSALAFRAGDQAYGAQTQFVPADSGGVRIMAGTLPFYAYDVLFDQERGGIAVRPNRTARGAVRPIF